MKYLIRKKIKSPWLVSNRVNILATSRYTECIFFFIKDTSYSNFKKQQARNIPLWENNNEPRVNLYLNLSLSIRTH